jgi:electron transport complex protein RnfA
MSPDYNFGTMLVYAFAVPAGYCLVMMLFSFIRTRLELNNADTPKAFQGNAIALIAAGLMAMAFVAFSGFAF